MRTKKPSLGTEAATEAMWSRAVFIATADAAVENTMIHFSWS